MNEQEKRKLRVCFTGHRPENLGMSEIKARSCLSKEIIKSIGEGFKIFITGMARGVDMWAAEIILSLKENYPELKLIAAVPYEGVEQKWSPKNKELYHRLLSKADWVIYICPKFSYSSYQMRNQWMVDHSSKVIAVWNGKKSGTKNTIDYAIKCGVKVINVYQIESN